MIPATFQIMWTRAHPPLDVPGPLLDGGGVGDIDDVASSVPALAPHPVHDVREARLVDVC